MSTPRVVAQKQLSYTSSYMSEAVKNTPVHLSCCSVKVIKVMDLYSASS